MIRQIDTSEAAPATSPKAVAPSTPAAKTFAAHLAGQKKVDEPKTKIHKDPIEAPRGEVWRPVRGGDHYAKITGGPREGLYINLSRGARRGETFRVEMRDGKRVHVYGQGKNEKVVLASKDSGRAKGDDAHTAAAHLARGETWSPVKGVSNYADILSGKRNGYFVNTSGGSRDGMAFQIVNRGGHTYHVYGKGKHRQMIEVHHKPKAQHSSAPATVTDTAAPTKSTTGATKSTDGS